MDLHNCMSRRNVWYHPPGAFLVWRKTSDRRTGVHDWILEIQSGLTLSQQTYTATYTHTYTYSIHTYGYIHVDSLNHSSFSLLFQRDPDREGKDTHGTFLWSNSSLSDSRHPPVFPFTTFTPLFLPRWFSLLPVFRIGIEILSLSFLFVSCSLHKHCTYFI